MGGQSFHREFSSSIQDQGHGWVRWVGGCSGQGGKAQDKEWTPVSKLGCLVKDMKISSLEEIFLFCLHIKESEIIVFPEGIHQG